MEAGDRPDARELAGASALAHRLVANAFRYRRAPLADLGRLRSMRHNDDLVPTTTRALQRLLDGVRRDSNIIYDIQGLQDHGVDVAVRLTDAIDVRFIGVQVKSHKEFVEDNPTSKLIAQYHAAREHFGDELTYYILACCDPSVPRVQDRLRDATSRFVKNTHVTVVEPAYAMSFLALRDAQLDSLTTQTLRSGDPVVSTALSELIGLHPLEAAIVLDLVEQFVARDVITVHFDELMSNQWLATVAVRAAQEASDTQKAYQAWDDPSIGTPPRFPDPLPGEEAWEHEGRIVEAYPGLRDLDPEQLAQLLVGPPDDLADAQQQALVDALDSLDDDDRVKVSDDHVRLRTANSLGLIALAAEGLLRHDLDQQELIDYLLEIVLL